MKKILLLAVLLASVSTLLTKAQTPIPDPVEVTVTTHSNPIQVCGGGDAVPIARAGGLTWRFVHSGSWPTNLVFAADDLAEDIIAGADNTIPTCDNLSDLSYSAGTSNLSGGILHFTGSTQWFSGSHAARLTMTFTTYPGGLPIALNYSAPLISMPVSGDFQVNVLIQQSSSNTPALDYYDCQNLSLNAGCCTSFNRSESLKFYSLCDLPVASCQPAVLQLDAYGIGSLEVSDVDDGSSADCGLQSLTIEPSTFDCCSGNTASVTLTVTDDNGNTADCTTTVNIVNSGGSMNATFPLTRKNTLFETVAGNLSDAQSDYIYSGRSSNQGAGLDIKRGLLYFDMSVIPAGAVISDASFDLRVDKSVLAGNEDYNLHRVQSNWGAGTSNTGTNGAGAPATIGDATWTCSYFLAPGSCITSWTNLGGDFNPVPSETQTVLGAGTSNTWDGAGLVDDVQYWLDNPGTNFGWILIGNEASTGTAKRFMGPGNTPILTVTWLEGCTDLIKPLAKCKAATVQIDASGNANLMISDVDDGSSDNCGNINMTLSEDAFDCTELGTHDVILTVADLENNTATCSAVVTVEDPLDNCCALVTPLLTFSSTFTDKSICSGNTPFFSPDGVVARTGSSQAIKVDITSSGVTGASSSYTFTQLARSLEIGVLSGSGSVTYVVTAYSFGPNGVDESGGGDDCLGQTATYVITVFALPTAVLTGGGTACPGATIPDITITFTGNGPWNMTYTDGTTSTTINPVTSNPIAINNPSDGTYTVTSLTSLGQTPNCTNTTPSNSITVSRVDNTSPVAQCKLANVQLDASGIGSLETSDVDNGSSDNCGTVLLEVDPNTFDCADIGTHTVTLTVTDLSGNTDMCTSTVSVADNLVPTISSCPSNIGPLSMNPGLCGSWVIWTEPSSSDNCPGELITQTSGPPPGSFFPEGITNIVYTAVDASGNTSTCGFTVQVLADGEDPVAKCKGASVQLDDNGNGSLSANEVDDGSSDNCPGLAMEVSPNTFDINDIGTQSVTLTVTDAAGNTDECMAVVTVTNNEPPVADCQDITINADGNCQGSAVAADFDGGSTDPNAGDVLSFEVVPMQPYVLGSTSVILTVSDQDGETSTCSATVTVQDNTPPTPVCQDASVQLDASGEASVVVSDIDNGSSDNCSSNLSLSINPSTFDCSNEGTNTVILTVLDEAGNSATCDATVTVMRTVAIDCNWTGLTNTHWFVGGNWSNGCVPQGPDDVYIPSSAPNQPHLMAGSSNIGSILLDPGASLIVDGTLTTSVSNGNAVTNNGDITVNGTLYFSGGDFVNNGVLKGNGAVLEGP
jgi:hypothetical protein